MTIREDGAPTPRQAEVLECIAQWFKRNETAGPTYAEIAELADVCVPTASRHIDALFELGFVHRQKGKRRSLRLTPAGLKIVEARQTV